MEGHEGLKRMTRSILAAIALALVLPACARKHRGSITTAPAPMVVLGATEEGMASWYGRPYHGRRTSSGEVYDMEKMTAAHRTLPFGTRVQVVNLSNGQNTEVRINDRGPFAHNRVIDVSRAAARQIQMLGPGTTRVRVRVVGLPEQALSGGYYAVQVGAFRDRRNAERLRAEMERRYGAAGVQDYDGPQGLFHRVMVGRWTDVPGAEELQRKLAQAGHDGVVVRVDSEQ